MSRLSICFSCSCVIVAVVFGSACRKNEPHSYLKKGKFFSVFGGPTPIPGHLSPRIAYNLDPSKENYFVYVPPNYAPVKRYGLIVFIYAAPTGELPLSWQKVLDAREYIFVAAQNSGNDQTASRRLGLAVLGALEITRTYHIDANRVYAAGFSGGARMAGRLGFYQPDIFRGTLQNCGADFYRPVPAINASSQFDSRGKRYGLLEASDDEIPQARNIRFAIITGTNDFRRGNILDIFHGGFERDGFKARLFDVQGMGHDICDNETLSSALDFLETGS